MKGCPFRSGRRAFFSPSKDYLKVGECCSNNLGQFSVFGLLG
jgi:hypothetical protein